MVEFMESVSDRTASYDQAAAKRFEEQVRGVFADVSSEDAGFTEHLSLILQHASAAGLLVRNQFLQVTKGFATVEASAKEAVRCHRSQDDSREEA
jgi:hypothetical protein